MQTKLPFLYTFLFLSTALFAQDHKYNNTGQFWSEIDLAGKIAKKWKWQVDLQYSRQSPYEQWNLFKFNSQLTIRPWIHYYPSDQFRISAFAGLWYNFAIPEVGAREYPEYRLAIQGNHYYRHDRSMLVNRLRAELREIKDRQGLYETVARIRYQLKFQQLIYHKDYDRNSIYFIAFDEFFVNGGSRVTGYKLFDQNRIFIGLGYNVTNDIAIESGYFNQLQIHAHDFNYDVNHIWQLTLVFDNLTKAKPHKISHKQAPASLE